MDLKSLFLDNLTSFHDLGHFIDWNHLNRPKVDSTQPLEDLLDMLRLVSLAVDNASGQLRLENFQNVQRVAQVQILNKFVRYFEHKFSFSAWRDFDSPKFGIFDRR